MDPVHQGVGTIKLLPVSTCLILCTSLMNTVLIYLRPLTNEYQCCKSGLSKVFTSFIAMCKIIMAVVRFFECVRSFYFHWQ